MPTTATVAENVRFKGGHFSQWINERYAGRGCALALEFKKTFMDEWSGEANLAHVGRLREALAATVPGIAVRAPGEAMTSPIATDLAVDRELASISESFRFLVDVTPINVEEARKEFLASPDREPTFLYRDIEDFPEVIGARLDAVDIDSVADPALAQIFAAKRRELSLQLDMLSARGTARFLELSLDLYGPVTAWLSNSQAEEILDEVPKAARRRERCLDANAIARMAADEIERLSNAATRSCRCPSRSGTTPAE